MLIAGVDEVGRGCVAGDVYAAAVILDNPIAGLCDSKKLNALKRIELSDMIKQQALCWGLGIASLKEIESFNILHATLIAMKRAVGQLSYHPDKVLVDGNHAPDWNYKTETIVGGDDSVVSISAASIIAKVARDNYMQEMAIKYPNYQFEQHKGYLTKAHRKALEEYGYCPLHRLGFKPIKSMIKTKFKTIA